VPVGQSTAHAHAIINVARGTAYTGFTPWLQLHTGDPGAAGTANASAETDRKQVTFAAPAAGSAVAPAVSWTGWDVGTETITHTSMWDAAAAGNFKMSSALAASKTVQNGDTLNVTATLTQGPIAS
jgi:hypothetical protein